MYCLTSYSVRGVKLWQVDFSLLFYTLLYTIFFFDSNHPVYFLWFIWYYFVSSMTMISITHVNVIIDWYSNKQYWFIEYYYDIYNCMQMSRLWMNEWMNEWINEWFMKRHASKHHSKLKELDCRGAQNPT